MEVIEPATGLLACKAVGKGKNAFRGSAAFSYFYRKSSMKHDMEGKTGFNYSRTDERGD